jgi:hypothetical protein
MRSEDELPSRRQAGAHIRLPVLCCWHRICVQDAVMVLHPQTVVRRPARLRSQTHRCRLLPSPCLAMYLSPLYPTVLSGSTDNGQSMP